MSANSSSDNLSEIDTKSTNSNIISTTPTNILLYGFNKIYTPITDQFFKEDINTFSLEKLRKYNDDISDECTKVMRTMCVTYKTKFDVALERINNRIVELEYPLFKTPITMDHKEEINGFKLYSYHTDVLSYDIYKELLKLSKLTKLWTYEEFEKEMRNNCCTDWYKQDIHGECYGGYWKYPKESEEYKNAWELSFKSACKSMWELPYPKEMLIYTIKLGCSNRMESVRYSNFLCEWVIRKEKAIISRSVNSNNDKTNKTTDNKSTDSVKILSKDQLFAR